MTTVFESPPVPHGDGEWYILADYNNKRFEQVKNQKFWKQIDKKSVNLVSKQILQFQKDVLDIHYDNEKRYLKLFSDYPVKFSEGDLYFYKIKDDGSFFIAILDIEKNRRFR